MSANGRRTRDFGSPGRQTPQQADVAYLAGHLDGRGGGGALDSIGRNLALRVATSAMLEYLPPNRDCPAPALRLRCARHPIILPAPAWSTCYPLLCSERSSKSWFNLPPQSPISGHRLSAHLFIGSWSAACPVAQLNASSSALQFLLSCSPHTLYPCPDKHLHSPTGRRTCAQRLLTYKNVIAVAEGRDRLRRTDHTADHRLRRMRVTPMMRCLHPSQTMTRNLHVTITLRA